MKKLGIGVRVRYIGGQRQYKNAALYLLIGRTGVIRSKSTAPGQDWFVEMDEGCYDLEAKANTLEPIEDDERDGYSEKSCELEAV